MTYVRMMFNKMLNYSMGENPNDTKSQDVKQDVKSMDKIFKILCHLKEKEVYLRWKKTRKQKRVH